MDRDADFALFAAGDVDGGDVRRLLKPFRDDVVGQDAQVARAAVALHGDIHDGLRGVVLLGDAGAVRVDRQALADRVHFLPHIRRRRVQVRPEVKRAADDGDARLRGRVDLLQAADAADGVLDRLGDQRLHLLRVGPGIGGVDRDDREVHLRVQLGGQPQVADDAQHQKRRHHHQNRNRAIDRQSCRTHSLSLVYCLKPATRPRLSALLCLAVRGLARRRGCRSRQ